MVFGVNLEGHHPDDGAGRGPGRGQRLHQRHRPGPPGLLRVGRILGARGLALERHVVLPAAFPSVLGGLKQGWAFAWHALMAGEFLILVNPLSLGGRTVNAVTQGDYAVVVAMMIVIVFIGIMVDVAFTRVDLSVRRRYGLLETADLNPPLRHGAGNL